MQAYASVVGALSCLSALHTNGDASIKQKNTAKIVIKYEMPTRAENTWQDINTSTAQKLKKYRS